MNRNEATALKGQDTHYTVPADANNNFEQQVENLPPKIAAGMKRQSSTVANKMRKTVSKVRVAVAQAPQKDGSQTYKLG